jgi:hypothetical protein
MAKVYTPNFFKGRSVGSQFYFYKFSTLNLCQWPTAMRAAAQPVPDSVKTSSSVSFLKHEEPSVRLTTAAAVPLLCKFLVPLASSVTCVQNSIPSHSFSHIHLCLGHSVCSCYSLMSCNSLKVTMHQSWQLKWENLEVEHLKILMVSHSPCQMYCFGPDRQSCIGCLAFSNDSGSPAVLMGPLYVFETTLSPLYLPWSCNSFPQTKF